MTVDARTHHLSDPLLQQHTLANGLRVLISPMPHVRSATVSLYMGAGSRYEADTDAGVSHLVEHCCFKGTERWPTAPELSGAIEGVGGMINASTDREFTVYYTKVPSQHLAAALQVLSEMALRPLFDGTELEKERQVILEELAMIEDSPAQLADVALDSILWPDQPIGRDIAGTPASVQGIAAERARSYRHAQYAPHNAVLSIAGAVDPNHVMALVAEHMQPWKHGTPDTWTAAREASDRAVRIVQKPTEQAHILVGLPGVSAVHPDRYVLSLLASILGDGMSSRLFVRLREELGLVYDIHAYTTHLQDTGAFSMYLGTDPDQALEALRATLGEVARIRDGIATAEVERVRQFVQGRMLLGMEDTRAVSAWYGGQALILRQTRSVEAVAAELDSVTPDDLQRVATALLREDRLHLAVVGPFETAAPFEEALCF